MYGNENDDQEQSDLIQSLFVIASYAKQTGRLQKWLLEHKAYVQIERVLESNIEESINDINGFLNESHIKGVKLNIPLSDVIFIFKSFVIGVDKDAVDSKIINELKKAFIKIQYFIMGEDVTDEIKEKNIIEFGVVIENIYIKSIEKIMSSYQRVNSSLSDNFIKMGMIDKKIKDAENIRKKQAHAMGVNQQNIIHRQEELIKVIGAINEK